MPWVEVERRIKNGLVHSFLRNQKVWPDWQCITVCRIGVENSERVALDTPITCLICLGYKQ